jgi:hypothetical protein
MAGTSEIKLDLNVVLDKLLLLKADLQAYRDDARDLREPRRMQITFALRRVGERALALEDLVERLGAGAVVVSAKHEAAERLRSAVLRFDRLDSIEDEDPLDDVVSRVLDALHAADVVYLRAAGGRPEAEARGDVQVERFARVDGSRSGVVVARIGPPSPLRVAHERRARSVGL